MRVAGLMSGTSFDGIDAAVADIELDGDELTLAAASATLSAPVRRRAARRHRGRAAARADDARRWCARSTPGSGRRSPSVAARAVDDVRPRRADRRRTARPCSTAAEDDAARCSSGSRRGSPSGPALPVVADLRARDVAAGGQGAPLVSLLDTLLLAGRAGTPAALNLGGIANLTVPPIAFDIGPANALLDAAARHFTGRPSTRTGGSRRAGTVDDALLDRAARATPTTRGPRRRRTGKEHFHAGYVELRPAAPRTCSPRSPR